MWVYLSIPLPNRWFNFGRMIREFTIWGPSTCIFRGNDRILCPWVKCYASYVLWYVYLIRKADIDLLLLSALKMGINIQVQFKCGIWDNLLIKHWKWDNKKYISVYQKRGFHHNSLQITGTFNFEVHSVVKLFL